MMSIYSARLVTTLSGKTRSFHSTCQRLVGQPSHATHPELISADEVTPRISRQEYKSRRDNLAQRLTKYDSKKRHVALIASHDRSYMAAGVPFIYRQHSNLTYFSGFLENESALLLEVDESGYTSTLFVKEHTTHENLWEGTRSGVSASRQLTGIDNTDNINNLETHLNKAGLNDDDTLFWYNKTVPISPKLHYRYLTRICDKVQPSNIRLIDSHIDSLRVIKSPSEIDLMRKCGDITAEMFMESMRFSVENPHEHLLFAKFDYECRINGGTNLAYLPVIAGGRNALTIHYIKNDSKISEDDMVLVDCGCDLHGYVSDVTRTWPVSGKFTEAQRNMYEAVEEIYKTCLQFCKPQEYTLDDIFHVMMALIAKQLIRLGVASDTISDKDLSQLAYKVCAHHVGHWLGMDVHDTPSVSRSTSLQPNQVICIEPGNTCEDLGHLNFLRRVMSHYVIHSDINDPPGHYHFTENKHVYPGMYFGEKDERVPKELRGVGIRIEDNILITDTGYENLTLAIPTSVEDIESILT